MEQLSIFVAPETASQPPATEVDPGSIPEVEHYELDGIPLFHLPMAGQTILTLAFRVGRADEPAPRGGMTHLAEHLILTSISDGLDHTNGTTEPFLVTFVKRGTPKEASRFLTDVCKAIERPSLTRMWQETQVLRTEAADRQSLMGLSLRLMWLRTGYQGIGAVNLPEFFLRTADESILGAWIAENLTAGNAAIWIAGELPDDLYVSLPPGKRRPMPGLAAIPGLETPTLFVEEAPGVGLGFVTDRTAAAATAFRAFERKLTHALRVDRRLGYQVGNNYLPINGDQALVSMWATCLPEVVRDVEQVLFETLDDLAARGPTEDELAQTYQRLVQEAADPMSIPGRLDARTRDELFGHPAQSLADLLDEQWHLQPEDVAAAVRRARETMIALIPPSGVDPQRPFKRYPGPVGGPMGAGRTFVPVIREKRRLGGKPKVPQLSIGELGVAIDTPDGRRMTGVRWADAVAVVCERDARLVVGRDGIAVRIDAPDWQDGRGAMKTIDRFAPRDTVVPESPAR